MTMLHTIPIITNKNSDDRIRGSILRSTPQMPSNDMIANVNNDTPVRT
tara:strand:+ start:365 stop:508 length:144 start_codon:yes stop_codon:yes gene_type:complete